MKTKTETPQSLQKLLIVSLLLAWFVSVVQITGLAAMQYQSNPNLSGFVSWALMTIVTPIVLVAIIYVTRRNKQRSLKTLFEVAIAAVASLAIYSSVVSLSVFAPPPLFTTDDSVLYYQLITSAVPLALTAAVMLAVLIRLRRRGQW